MLFQQEAVPRWMIQGHQWFGKIIAYPMQSGAEWLRWWDGSGVVIGPMRGLTG